MATAGAVALVAAAVAAPAALAQAVPEPGASVGL